MYKELTYDLGENGDIWRYGDMENGEWRDISLTNISCRGLVK